MSDRYWQLVNERDALATQLAETWGWPAEPYAVLERLRGDRTTALTTFTEDAYLHYLGTPKRAQESA